LIRPLSDATVLIVPGLRDESAAHWQSLLVTELQRVGRPVRSVKPLGRGNLDCALRVAEVQQEAAAANGPLIIVGHSGGALTVAHWAGLARGEVRGALLAVPPNFEVPMPVGYPSLDAVSAGGWLPLPRAPLPFPSIVAASRNDPLASYEWVTALAADWHSRVVDLGAVGHLNPASGFGPWPRASELIAALDVLHPQEH
jgi:uncharacterized protein